MIIELNDASLLTFSWWSFAALAVLGHNFWLIAKPQSDRIRIEANTGHNFPDGESAVKPERVREFKAVALDSSTAITDFRVEENSLVADLKAFANKSFYAAIELHSHPITLDARKFAGYIREENAFALVAPGFVENETTVEQRESYAKFAKVFLALDEQTANEAFNLTVGHRFEIVARTSFAELKEQGILTVQVLLENQPVANLRVSSGCENQGGAQYFAHRQTDENGLATFNIETAGQWFLRTHLIRSHTKLKDYDWESFWAALTFVR